ncbi:MAG: PAS domain-containing protein [Flavobacteriales bacterium]|nr:PAS domain-containing protein [Flavobacteriales bacterium]
MEPIRIIIVEDFHAETEAVVRELEEADMNFVTEVVTTKKDFKKALGSFNPDVILSSYSLAETNAIKLLGTTRKSGVMAPFILLAFDLSEDIAIDLLGAGVEDYVLRSTLKRLPVAIKKALQRYKTQLELLMSEVKLRSSETSLREAQKIAKVGSWEWNLSTNQVICSDEMFRIYDCDPDSFTLEDARNFIHPKDRERVAELMEEALPSGVLPVLEYTIVTADGQTKEVRAIAEAIKNPKGEVVKLFGTLQDITERKKIEQKLFWKQGLLELGEEISDSGSFELDLTNRKTKWSPNFYRITGIKPDTVIRRAFFVSCVHPDDREEYERILEESIRTNTGKPHVYRFIRPDNGQVIHLQSNGRRVNTEDNTVRWIGSVQDISERVRTQHELERSKASLMEAQKIAKVGSWEWEAGSEEVWWSEEMFHIYETDKKNITIEDVRSFIHPEDRARVDAITANDLNAMFTSVIEYRLLLASGQVKHVVSSAKQIKDATGKVTRLIGTLQDVTDSVQATKEREAYRIQRELTLHAAQIGVWHWELDRSELFWDDRCYDIYGIEKRPISTQEFVGFIHEDDRDAMQRCITESFISGDYKAEYRIRVADGVKFLMSRGKVTFGSNGQPTRMDGIILDMTERHEMETALRESERLFRDMAENITEVFWLTDWKLNEVLYISPQYETLYGLSVESLYEDPTSWSKAIHPDDLDRATVQFRELAITGKYDEEYRLVMKDGTIKWVRDRAFPVYGPDGSVSRVAGITEDITKQKLDKERIETLSLVASETINGVLIHEPDGKIIWANKGFTNITGFSSEEVIGKEPWSIVGGPETNQKLVEMTYAKIMAGKPFTSVNSLRHKEGHSVWVNVSYAPILDDYGNVIKIVSIGTDITKQKEVEQLQRDMLQKLEKANRELKERAGDQPS